MDDALVQAPGRQRSRVQRDPEGGWVALDRRGAEIGGAGFRWNSRAAARTAVTETDCLEDAEMAASHPWAPIPGFEGRYEVNDLGRVRSMSRVLQGRELTQVESAGYLRVNLSPPDGRPRLCLVHRLVLTAFVGPCPPGMEALHINGDARDNRLANLRWGTRAENVADQVAHGRARSAMKQRRVLSDADAAFIRANHKVIKQADLAEMFGVHRATIQRIHSGERYE